MILLAGAFFASAGFVTKHYYGGVPAVPRAFAALALTAAATCVPAALDPWSGPPSAGPVIGVLLLGFGSTACAVLAVFTLLDEVGAGRAALVTYLAPGFSVVLAALVLGEPITAPAVAGLALILGGVALASRAERPRAAPPSPQGGEERPEH